MATYTDSTVDALVRMAMAGDARFQNVEHDDLPARVAGAVATGLDEWNLDWADVENATFVKVSYNQDQQTLYTVELSGTPGVAFTARMVVEGGTVLEKSIHVDE